jgi:hypothetical protein
MARIRLSTGFSALQWCRRKEGIHPAVQIDGVYIEGL